MHTCQIWNKIIWQPHAVILWWQIISEKFQKVMLYNYHWYQEIPLEIYTPLLCKGYIVEEKKKKKKKKKKPSPRVPREKCEN